VIRGSRSAASRKPCKLSAADWREIRRLSEGLQIDLWFRETEEIVQREMVAQGWPSISFSLSMRGRGASANAGRSGLRLVT
jgi:hypothetical protein